MRKTVAQPEIRPKRRIKIPSTLRNSEQKEGFIDSQFYEQVPIINKKDLLEEAARMRQLEPTHRSIISRASPSRNIATRKKGADEGSEKYLKRAQTSEKNLRLSFKIKMTGAGFRQKGKEVKLTRSTKSLQKAQTGGWEFSKPQTGWQNSKPYSLQTFNLNEFSKPKTSQSKSFKNRSKSKQIVNEFEVLKAYYSTQIKKQEFAEKVEEFNYFSAQISDDKRIDINFQQPSLNRVNIDTFRSQSLNTFIPLAGENADCLVQSDFQWNKEQVEYENEGFGVNKNLSEYDIESLADPDGVAFLIKYQNKQAKCPIFKGEKYLWKTVRILGFDKRTNRAIITGNNNKNNGKNNGKNNDNDDKKQFVSRLSLNFAKDAKSENEYWKRIKEAKRIRKAVKEELKYMGYLDRREERYAMKESIAIDESIPEKWAKIVEKQLHERYAKHLVVMGEMAKNYIPFKEVGIDFREYQPHKTIVKIGRFANFKQTRALIQQQHYVNMKNVASSLRVMRKRIFQQTQVSIFQPPTMSQQLQTFTRSQCQSIEKSMVRLKKLTRETIITESISKLKNSFEKGKDQFGSEKQKRFFKLHNIMFRNLAISHYFYHNIDSLIQYFDQFNYWTPHRSEPFLNLQLLIQDHRIVTLPNENQTYNQLYRPFLFLHEQFCKVEDLTSDLLFDKPQYLSAELPPTISPTLKRTVSNSLSNINLYIQKISPHLRYLSTLPFSLLPFAASAIVGYEQTLLKIESDLKEVLHSCLYKSGIYSVSLEKIKKPLKQAISLRKQKIMKSIQKQAIEQNNSMLKEFQTVKNQLKTTPQNEEQFIEMRNYLNVYCEEFLEKAKEHYNLCSNFYLLLERHCHVSRWKEEEKFMVSIIEHYELQKIINRKKGELFDVERELISRINVERESILKGIDEARLHIESLIALSNFEEYKENYIKISKMYFSLQDSITHLDDINRRETLLSQDLSIFPLLPRLLKTITPYYDMWNNIYHFMIDNNEWVEMPIITINYEEVKNKVYGVYKKELERLSRSFEAGKNMEAVTVCEMGLKLVRGIEQILWIVEAFTKEGMLKKSNIMGEVLGRVYGPDAPENFKHVNLNELLKRDVSSHRTYIQKQSNRAEKIWALEKRINTIILQIKELYFEIGEKNSVHCINSNLLLSLTMSVKEGLESMEMVRSEPESTEILKKINHTYGKIKIIEETLVSIGKFQGDFMKMHRVFQVNEIISDLADEKKSMNETLRIWSSIMRHFLKDLQVWEAIDSQSYRNRLDSYAKILQTIYQKLRNYFNLKRAIYPRLFFVSDEEMVEMVAAEQDYIIVADRMALLFQGFIRFVHKNNQIVGVASCYGGCEEKIMFKRGVGCSIIIWERLKYVQEELTGCIRHLKAAVPSNQHPLSIRLLNELIEWTLTMQTTIKKGAKETQALLQPQSKRLPFASHAQSCLLVLKGMLRDRHVELVREKVESLGNFQWLKMIRMYRGNNIVLMKTLSHGIEVGCEYEGICAVSDLLSMFCTPKENYHIVLHLQKIYHSTSTPALTSTIRNLALLLMRHYIPIECPTDPYLLTQTLKGYFSQLTQVWGVLILPSLPCLEMLSLLAESAYQVRRAIVGRENYMCLLGSDIKIENVTDSYNNVHFVWDDYKNMGGGAAGEVLRQCYRGLTFLSLSWRAVLSSLSLGSINPDNESNDCEEMVRWVEELIIDYPYLERRIPLLIDQSLRDSIQSSQPILMILTLKVKTFLTPQNSHDADHDEYVKASDDEVRALKEMVTASIEQFHQEREPFTYNFPTLLVMGSRGCGKAHLIEKCLLQLGQIPVFHAPFIDVVLHNNIVEKQSKQCPKWLVLETGLQSMERQRQTILRELHEDKIGVIFKVQSFQAITPSIISTCKIFNKKSLSHTYHATLRHLCQSKLSQEPILADELIRVTLIFIRNFFEAFPSHQLSAEDLNWFVIHCVEAVEGMNRESSVDSWELRDATEIIFTLVLWMGRKMVDSVTSRNHLGVSTLDPSGGNYEMFMYELSRKVGSSILGDASGGGKMKNPYDYWWSTEKKSYIEWNVVQCNEHFDKTHQSFTDIYLPVKETVSALFLAKSLLPHHDVLVYTSMQQRGSGVSSLLNKIVGSQKQVGTISSQSFIAHGRFSGKNICQTVQSSYTFRRLDGFFTPYQNSTMIIAIDDVNFVSPPKEDCQEFTQSYLKYLLKYRTESLSKMRIANTRVILGYQKRGEDSRNALNPCLPIQLRGLGEQSVRNIYNYIFDWFFGNTDNPFSKEVREMKGLLIDLNIRYAMGYRDTGEEDEYGDLVSRIRLMDNFGTSCRVLRFMCCSSPRAVKKSEEIIALWMQQFFEIYSIVSSQRESIIQQILSLLPEKVDQHSLRLEVQKIFAKLHPSQDYQQITLAEAHCKILEGLDQHQMIILFPELIRQILTATRLFLSRNTHFFNVDYGQSGKATLLSIAGMLTNHAKPQFINESGHQDWRLKIIDVLKKWASEEKEQEGERGGEGEGIVENLANINPIAFKNSNEKKKAIFKVLVFKVDSQSSAFYLETICEFLLYQISNLLTLLPPIPRLQTDQLDQENKHYPSLLQKLEMHSHQTPKYKNFVSKLKQELQIVVNVDNQSKYTIVKDFPVLIKKCAIVHPCPPSLSYYNVAYGALQRLCHSFVAEEGQEMLKSYCEKVMGIYTKIKVIGKVNHSEEKQCFLKWLIIALKYFRKAEEGIESRIRKLHSLLDKGEQTVRQLKQLEKELASLRPKLAKAKQKNESILITVKEQKEICLGKKKYYDQEEQKCQAQRRKTKDMSDECEMELGKVMPMLQAAEESLEKVTRDDINQLRSFPNPPLSAVKVVEALCFVFNEDHLVKEKVLDSGVKIRDYWDYAKKFILNDKLLKRVAEFKPEYIKTLNKLKMGMLSNITKQPEFEQDRVFKASSAAGNLSIWMRAVVSTFEVMEIIDPKRKLLNEALEALATFEQFLSEIRQDMDENFNELNKREVYYNSEMKKQQQIEDKIEWLERTIQRGKKFLILLHRMEDEWRKEIRHEDRIKRQSIIMEGLMMAIYHVYVGRVGFQERAEADNLLKSFRVEENWVVEHKYLPKFLKSAIAYQKEDLHEKEEQNNENQSGEQAAQHLQASDLSLPSPPSSSSQAIEKQQQTISNTKLSLPPLISHHYSYNTIILLERLFFLREKLTIVLDETQSYHSLIEKEDHPDKLVAVDCLSKRNVGDILEALERESESEERTMFLLRNLEHCPQEWMQKVVYKCEIGYPLTTVVVLFQQMPHYPPPPLHIHNELCMQTKQSYLQLLICPITTPKTPLFHSLENFEFQDFLESKSKTMKETLLESENILLDDYRIGLWMGSYAQFWEGSSGGQREIGKKGKAQTSVIEGLAQGVYWRSVVRFPDFWCMLKQRLYEGGREVIFTLPNDMEAYFDEQAKAILNESTNKDPLNHISQPQAPSFLGPLYIQFTELSSAPSHLLQNWLSTHPFAELYFKGSVFSILPYLSENSKHIYIVVDTKNEAYLLYEEVRAFIDGFVSKKMREQEDFDAAQYGFRCDLLIVRERRMLVDRQWVVRQSSPNEFEDGKWVGKKIKSNSKAEKEYMMSLLTNKDDQNV